MLTIGENIVEVVEEMLSSYRDMLRSCLENGRDTNGEPDPEDVESDFETALELEAVRRVLHYMDHQKQSL
jgi:hypothetical protein